LKNIKDKLITLCADNHEKCSYPRPFEKSSEFFVQLPFKLNEDANLTKATHPGMSPLVLQLARKECNK